MNEHQAILFLSGILFAQLFSKVLKNIINNHDQLNLKHMVCHQAEQLL